MTRNLLLNVNNLNVRLDGMVGQEHTLIIIVGVENDVITGDAVNIVI